MQDFDDELLAYTTCSTQTHVQTHLKHWKGKWKGTSKHRSKLGYTVHLCVLLTKLVPFVVVDVPGALMH